MRQSVFLTKGLPAYVEQRRRRREHLEVIGKYGKRERQLPAVRVGGLTKHLAKNRELQSSSRWWREVIARSVRIRAPAKPISEIALKAH
jgi:hypothetical protein